MEDFLEILGPFRLVVIVAVTTYIIATAVFNIWYFYIVYSGKDPKCKAPLPPGEMGWPVIGESFKVLMQGTKFYSGRFRQYNCRLFKTHIFGLPTIRLYGAENLHTILHGENDIVESQWPESTRNLLGNALTLSTGDRHSMLRKHVSRAFTHDALDGYLQLLLPIVREGIESWCTQDSVLAFDVTRRMLFDIAAVVLCGFDREDIEGGEMAEKFMDFTKGFFTLPFDLPGTPYRKALLAKKILLSKLDTVVERKIGIASEEDTRNALRILMDHSGDGDVTIENLKADMIDLLNAGFNTTSSAATTLLYYVSRKPELMANIRQELEQFGLTKQSSDLTFDRLVECKYLSNVVREGLRLAPPIGGGFRKVLKTFELEGYQIPKGWMILYSIRDTVQFSDSYSDKNEFDPERFAPHRQEDQKGGRYNYPIFGGGQRSCMGKQFAQLILRTLLAELALTCEVEPVNPEETVTFNVLPIPHPRNGLPLRFKRLQAV